MPTVICYVASLIVSISSLVVVITKMFADEESRFANFVNDTDIYVLIGIAVALLVVGFRLEKSEV